MFALVRLNFRQHFAMVGNGLAKTNTCLLSLKGCAPWKGLSLERLSGQQFPLLAWEFLLLVSALLRLRTVLWNSTVSVWFEPQGATLRSPLFTAVEPQAAVLSEQTSYGWPICPAPVCEDQ